MISNFSNSKEKDKHSSAANPSKNSKFKYRPKIDAEQIILENEIVNRLQNAIAYANEFGGLRSFRLRLEMEEAA